MGDVLQAQQGRGGREGRYCSWEWGAAHVISLSEPWELLLKHFLSLPDPWAGEAGVLELDLHFCTLPLSSQEQRIETSREWLWTPGFGTLWACLWVRASRTALQTRSQPGQVGSKEGPSLVSTAHLLRARQELGDGALSSSADSARTGLRKGGVGSGPPCAEETFPCRTACFSKHSSPALGAHRGTSGIPPPTSLPPRPSVPSLST